MSEIEKRQQNGDGVSSFEKLLEGYHPNIPIPPISRDEPTTETSSPDIVLANQISRQAVTPGTVPLTASVRSVYDTRPVNAYDVIFDTVKTDATALAVGANLFSVAVPDGYVIVIRGIKFTINPLPAISTNDRDYLLTLLLNNSTVPNYQNIPVGPVMNNWLPCHFIAAENETFGIRYNVLPAIAPALFFMNVQFHCNLLLSEGIPKPFVIANHEILKKKDGD